MVELDYDKVLEELINLVKTPHDSVDNPFPETLEQYLKNVAKTGDIIFPWCKVKPFIRKKMETVIENFNKKYPLDDSHKRVPNCDPFDYEGIKMNILQSFDWFCAAPFTIQRLCELLIDPYRHYSRTDKFMRGLEKNVIVVSTVQPHPNKYSETIEKQSSFRDLYPQFSSSRGRAASISAVMERSQTPPLPPTASSSSCPSSRAPSPSSNHANANMLTNGYNDNNGTNNQSGNPLVHHHHGPPPHPHHHNHHPLSPHPKAAHHSNRPFDGPYSMVHLANSNSSTTGLFYDGSSHHHSQTQNSQSAGNSGNEQQSVAAANANHYPGVGGNPPSSNVGSGLSAPLHQLDSFTSVFVATSYLTNQMNHSVSGSSPVTAPGSSPPSSSNELHHHHHHHHQSSPQPHRTNWSPSADSSHHRHFGSLISSSSASVEASTAAANDENENIVVDDDYEQHPYRSGSAVVPEVPESNLSTRSETPEAESHSLSTGDSSGPSSRTADTEVYPSKDAAPSDDKSVSCSQEKDPETTEDELSLTPKKRPSLPAKTDLAEVGNVESGENFAVQPGAPESIQEQQNLKKPKLLDESVGILNESETKKPDDKSSEQLLDAVVACEQETSISCSNDKDLVNVTDQQLAENPKVDQEDLPMDMSNSGQQAQADTMQVEETEQEEEMMTGVDGNGSSSQQPMAVENQEDQLMSEPMEQE